MASEFKARLVLVHAIPSLQFNPSTYYFDTEFRKVVVSQAKEQVTAMAQKCGVVNAGMDIDGGTVADVVRSAAKTHNADLVVVGRPTKTGIVGRLQTNTYSIIRESPCPVVSV
jgi:nucleotide-binding universal stress UspA family protein